MVKIDGTEVPCDAASLAPGILSGLKVTWGREDRLARPAASTCDFQIVDPDGGDEYTDVVAYGSVVEVLALTPTNGQFRVFYGRVTDLSLIHESGTDAVLTVTAVDPTADMSSVMVGDTPWPAQTSNQRRSAILSAIGGSTVFYWQPFETSTGASAYPMAAKDVDNQPSWEVISDFLWGIACIPWPIAYGTTGRPGIIVTGQGLSRERQLGVYDTRANSAVPTADFLTAYIEGVQYPIPTVCLDACDIDLEGTEFTTNPSDTSKTVRLTYGDENNTKTFIYTPTSADVNRTFEVDSGLAGDVYGELAAPVVADHWYDQMNQWWQDFNAPWRVGTVHIDPDTVTGIDDFHLVLRRLLDQTYRINHNVLLQRLPRWAPWRGASFQRRPNVIGLLQGGTYTYEDGRWLLDLTITVERRLISALAPPPVVTVSPGDVVPYQHDTTDVELVADPSTLWAVGQYATFTDGRYGWDGTTWIYGGVQPIYVHPGETTTLAHDDPRVRPDPATPWAARTYATFSDGRYTWGGSAWLAMVEVRPGDTSTLAHDSPNILPSPTREWSGAAHGGYATFSDGIYHWSGADWLAVVVVRPGDTVNTFPGSLTVLPDPQTSWLQGQYANFLQTSPYQRRWTGNTWQTMVIVKPGGSTSAQPDDPRLLASPTTPWAPDQYATLGDGQRYTWDGDSWEVWIDPGVKVQPYDHPDADHTGAVWASPATPWDDDQYATFNDGEFGWDGSTWRAVSWTTVRENLALNPRGAGGAAATDWTWNPGTGSVVTLSSPSATDTPNGQAGYRRATITTADAGGYAGHAYKCDPTADVGDVLSMSAFVRPPVALTYTLNASSRAANLTADSAASPATPVPANTWTRLATVLTLTKAFDALQAVLNETEAGPAAGTTVDAVGMLFERGGVLGTYFDGDTPDTDTERHAWTGAANASTSVLSTPSWSASPVEVIVRPGDTVDTTHDDPAVVPVPATAWADDDYATFTDGTYRWDGAAWVVVVPVITVAPGDTVAHAHDATDVELVADPATAWGARQFATFTDGTYRWDGAAWVVYAPNTDTTWAGAPADLTWADVPDGTSWNDWTGDI